MPVFLTDTWPTFAGWLLVIFFALAAVLWLITGRILDREARQHALDQRGEGEGCINLHGSERR